MNSANSTGSTIYLTVLLGFGKSNQIGSLHFAILNGVNKMDNFSDIKRDPVPPGIPEEQVSYSFYANTKYYRDHWNWNEAEGKPYSEFWNSCKIGDVIVLSLIYGCDYKVEVFRKGLLFEVGISDGDYLFDKLFIK